MNDKINKKYLCMMYKLLYLRLFSGFYLSFWSYGEKTVVFAGMYLKLWCRNTSMLTLDGNSLDLCLVTILLAKEKIHSDGTDIAGMYIRAGHSKLFFKFW